MLLIPKGLIEPRLLITAGTTMKIPFGQEDSLGRRRFGQPLGIKVVAASGPRALNFDASLLSAFQAPVPEAT